MIESFESLFQSQSLGGGVTQGLANLKPGLYVMRGDPNAPPLINQGSE